MERAWSCKFVNTETKWKTQNAKCCLIMGLKKKLLVIFYFFTEIIKKRETELQ